MLWIKMYYTSISGIYTGNVDNKWGRVSFDTPPKKRKKR